MQRRVFWDKTCIHGAGAHRTVHGARPGLAELKDEHTAAMEMRGLASWYLKGLRHGKKYKDRLSRIQSLAELEEVLQAYLAAWEADQEQLSGQREEPGLHRCETVVNSQIPGSDENRLHNLGAFPKETQMR